MSRQKPVVISRGVILNAERGGVDSCSDAMLMCFLLLQGLQALCTQNSQQSLAWSRMHREK